MMTVDIDIPMADLDYFPTTNLLFSGQHIFIADSPKPDSNSDHGVAVPRDLILTGQVAEKVFSTGLEDELSLARITAPLNQGDPTLYKIVYCVYLRSYVKGFT